MKWIGEGTWAGIRDEIKLQRIKLSYGEKGVVERRVWREGLCGGKDYVVGRMMWRIECGGEDDVAERLTWWKG